MLQVISRIKAVKWVEHIRIQHDSTVNLSICLVQPAVKVIERKQRHSLHFIYEQSVLREAQKIISDTSHTLHFTLNKSIYLVANVESSKMENELF